MDNYNLLFIYTDEQAFNTLAAYGNDQICMPNLNRFAGESTVFDRAYVTQPVCTPSRSSLLTGLYPHTNGCIENNVPLKSGIPCFPEMISRGKYATAHHGKWHLGDEVFAQHGFDEWISIEDMYSRHYSEGRDKGERSSYHKFLMEQDLMPKNGHTFGRGETAHFDEEYCRPKFLAREASRFITNNKENPFILYVNFLEPHMPFFGPRNDQHNIAEIPLPPNFENTPTESEPLKARLVQQEYFRRGHSGTPLETEDDWKRLKCNYWGLCSLVDTYAGKILETIDECGLRDNTIVVFTSDHGDMMGSHGLLAKCVMYEEAIRVPFMIRLPGQNKGRRITGPVSQIDMVPTLLDLMDQPVPGNLEGKSLKPLLEDEARNEHHENVFVEWNGHNNGLGDKMGKVNIPDWMTEMASLEEIEAAISDPVRTVITPDGWKLNFSPRGEHELYDLNNDPYETRNLAEDPVQKSRIEDLTGRIREWQKETQDQVSI